MKKSKNPTCKTCGKEFQVYFSWNGTGKAGLVLLAHTPEDYHKCTRILKVADLSSYLEVEDKIHPNNVHIAVKRHAACYKNICPVDFETEESEEEECSSTKFENDLETIS